MASTREREYTVAEAAPPPSGRSTRPPMLATRRRERTAVLEGGHGQPALPACSRFETREEEQQHFGSKEFQRGEYVLQRGGRPRE